MGEAIVYGAAILGGATTIGGAAWRWVVAPAFAKTVREIVQAENAAALKPIIDELSFNSGKSVKDMVVRIDAQLDTHLRLHERADR